MSFNLIMREGGNLKALKALHICTSVQLWTPNGSDWAFCDVVFSDQLWPQVSASICRDVTACSAEDIPSEGTEPGEICNFTWDKKSHTISDLMHTESIYCTAVMQHKNGNFDIETLSQTEGEAKTGRKLSNSARKRRPGGWGGGDGMREKSCGRKRQMRNG